MIPHAGPMCLLDGVRSWDSTRIRCFSQSHLHPGNPLRAGGLLPAICGIEYAAQAMALHGGLTGAVRGKPAAGYLASVRDVSCHAERLDTEGELVIEAEQLAVNDLSVMYRFTLSVNGVAVLDGRATVILEVVAQPR
jgi:predicted hotdog family 3-hydroxylacyl-ACP dehydratase